MTEQTTTQRAEDRKAGLTLAELFQFAQAALAAGTDPREPVRATMGWRSQITAIATGPRTP
ncbi:hypothetical protein LG293_09890 [Citricoccus nitrophenolicus]